MQWHNIKNIKEKTCQVTWCYRVSHRRLETFKNPFFSFNISCSTKLAFKIVTSLEFTSYLLQLYQNFCIFSQVFHSPVCLFLLSNLSFNKETKKKSSKNLPMCDKDATVGNIEYIVSFFFLNQKITTRYIAQKITHWSTVQYQMFKKSSQSSFFTGHIQVF